MQSAGLSSRPGDTQTEERMKETGERNKQTNPDESETTSTCSSTLLVVVLDGLADGVVDDKPDVRLVDTHAKRHRGYYHLHQHKQVPEHQWCWVLFLMRQFDYHVDFIVKDAR